MIISWPQGTKDKGGLSTQVLHTIDMVPTLYEISDQRIRGLNSEAAIGATMSHGESGL